MQILFRVLSGMVYHPNVGAVVLVGLGCEVSNTRMLAAAIGDAGKPVKIFNVQEDGGSLATARRTAGTACRLLAQLCTQRRVPHFAVTVRFTIGVPAVAITSSSPATLVGS